MATGVQSWSQTAASNATADSAVNYAEGQAPASLNDSARAAMASTAKWRDDISGTITTGGTSTAYTVASNQGLSLAAGTMVAFVPHTTNAATVTLNVDGLGAKPLRSAPGSTAEIPAGVLVQGTPYGATYYTSNSGEWILHGFYGNPYSIPIGGLLPYLPSSAPNSSFVLPYGQAISRTTYAGLFSLVGTAYGSGDGTTTFNIPDIRDRAIYGWGAMGGTPAGRISGLSGGWVGSTLGASGGAQSHTLTTAQIPANIPNSAATQYFPTFNNTYVVGTSSTFVSQQSADVQIPNALASINLLGSATTTVTINPSGGGAHNNMPPGISLPVILRVI